MAGHARTICVLTPCSIDDDDDFKKKSRVQCLSSYRPLEQAWGVVR